MNEREIERRIKAGEAPPHRGFTKWVEDDPTTFALGVCLLIAILVFVAI